MVKWSEASQKEVQDFIQKVTAEAEKADGESYLKKDLKMSYGEQLKAWREKLKEKEEKALTNVWRHGNEFQKLLSVVSRFNIMTSEDALGKGIQNAVLIYNQDPEATELKTFDQWKSKNVSILKDSKAITILVNHESNGKRYKNPKNVFDISRTTAKDTQRPPERKAQGNIDIIKSVANSRMFGIVEREDLPEDLGAVYIPAINEIWVENGLEPEELSILLLREASHYYLAKNDLNYTRDKTTEFKGYMSAYMSAEYFGLDAKKQMPFPEAAFPNVQVPGNIKSLISGAKDISSEVCKTVEKTLEVVKAYQAEEKTL